MKAVNKRLRKSLSHLPRFSARGARATLALGGGGARGIAHLGAMEVLRGLGVRVEHVVGVSIGSLAGALCAINEDIVDVQHRVKELVTSEKFEEQQSKMFATAPATDEPSASGMFAWWDQMSRFLGARRRMLDLIRRPSLLPATFIQDIITALLPDIDIRDARIPLSIVALDLQTGQQVTLSRGSLRSAVLASTAIPGIFPPVDIDGRQLVDIGVVDALPVAVAAEYGSDLTIAVDVGADVEPSPPLTTAKDIFLRINDITERHVRRYTRGMADLVIRPPVAGRPWYDFSKPDELIECGRVATRQALFREFVRQTVAGNRAAQSASAQSKSVQSQSAQPASAQSSVAGQD